MTGVWSRLRAGKHAMAFGDLPDPPGALTLVRVACDIPGTLGPLDEAYAEVMRRLGQEAPLWEHAVEDVTNIALRRQALGEVAIHTVEADFVGACNRLAAQSDVPVGVVFEAFDDADEATHEAVLEVLGQPGWLRVPLLLHCRRPRPEGLVAAIAQVLQEREGEEAVVGLEVEPRPAPPTPAAPVAYDLAGLPTPLLRLLRAAAMIGGTFEADLVARLLEQAEGEVLIGLQEAADLGVPLADRGHGLFSMPAEVVWSLRQRLLPSLEAHWHRRLAELVVRSPAPRAQAEATAQPRVERRPAAAPPEARTPAAATAAPPEARAPQAEPQAEDPYGALFQGVDEEATREPANIGARTAPAGEVTTGGDPARAARHLKAAGKIDEAVDRYLDAIHQLERRGDARRALMLIREALEVLEPTRSSPAGALRRARLFAADGRLRWRGAGLGTAFTLSRALESLEAARASFPPQASPGEVAAVAAAMAGVCLDLGDVKSLERALEELARASRVLQDAGDAVGAARYLNDQAQVHLRAGDPVRATHLLKQSRDVFERLRSRRADDRVVIEELAETELLLAKLPLQARLRPGREEDAMSMALGHARAAETAYRKLESARGLARVWQTMGRLELRRRHLDRAAQHFEDAAELQRDGSDFVGLANTAAGLSDVYAAAGRPMDALALLGESITLNLDKGSPAGLAFNRRAIQTLRQAVQSLSPAEQQELAPALTGVERHLAEAEAQLGRIELAGA